MEGKWMRPLVLSSFLLSESRGSGTRATFWYVAKVKGDGGVDWEWTNDVGKAARVSYYWARRFMADRRSCGIRTARAQEIGQEIES
jgi:hypothetical protein